MKNFNILYLFVSYSLILFGFNSAIFTATNLDVSEACLPDRSIENTFKDKFDFSKNKKNKSCIKNINFSFRDVDLIDVINEIAEERGENIILPSGKDTIKSKLTIDIPEKLTSQEAWDTLNTILDVAGYVISQAADGMLKIVIKDENLVKNAFRIFKEEQSSIFVDTDYKDIPDTDERIIFLCYFDNIQVPQADQSGGDANIIQEIIQIYTGKNVAANSDRGTASFRFIPGANGVVIVDKANNIRSMMKIFSELDKAGFKENLEKIKLENVAAQTVADMFNDENKGIIGKKQKNTYKLGKRKKSKKSYFDKETKVVAEPKSNSLILMGNKEAIDRIKEFIFRFIDIPVEGGRSVLHRKKLDYLDCDKLRDVLNKIVSQATDEGSQARAYSQSSGPERFFSDGIKIETDKPKQESDSKGESGQYKYSGTNSLLIAAKNDDWKKIDELIEKLDKPLRQVIIEVLIVDLIMDGNRILGSQTRNPSIAPLFNISQDGRPMNAQSAQLAAVQTSACEEKCSSTSGTLAADLMQGITNSDKKIALPYSVPAGSTLMTLSDNNGSTWSVLKILESYENSKILSHPYIVAVDNKPAMVKVGITKRLFGTVSGTTAGVNDRKTIDVDGLIKVNVTPKIGGLDEKGDPSVNLRISISINEFEDTKPKVDQSGSNPMNIREISTNANIKNGEILALGGLIRMDSTNNEGKTPILGRIPLIGWLFKQRDAGKRKTNLTVFIRATVVEPTAKGKMDKYSKDYINVAKSYSSEGGLFDELRDPITRWFFGSDNTAESRIDEFTKINQKDISTEELKYAETKFGPDFGLAGDTILTKNDMKKNKSSRDLHRKGRSSSCGSSVKDAAHKTLDDLTASDISCGDLSRGDLSHVNASCSDIAQIELKDDKGIVGQNSYELFEDGSKQEDLLVNACQKIPEGSDKLKSMLQKIDNPFISG